MLKRFFSLSPRHLVYLLIIFGLAKSLLIAAIITPSYGSDGRGYVKYTAVMLNPVNPEDLWEFRGSTPVYPLFSALGYWIGGYGIVMLQLALGILSAPAIYLGLRSVGEREARLAGFLIALDPQVGLLHQQVATETLYISLLTLSFAGFWWLMAKPRPLWQVALWGILLGLGSLTRPVGLFLIVPYAVFYVVISRSLSQTLLATAVFLSVLGGISFLNQQTFGYFAPYNTGGFYLATRLFGVGELYDIHNGENSERLYFLAGTCYLDLSDVDDAENLLITRYLRECLYYRHGMSFDEISRLYQSVYAEATQAKPSAFLGTMLRQAIHFMWQSSDPHDLNAMQNLSIDCQSASGEMWYDPASFFCPKPPQPLAGLQKTLFLMILAFSVLTRSFVNFSLAGIASIWSKAQTRYLLLMCLGLYSYHLVVTSAAGTILARYITATNPYVLIPLAFACVFFWEKYNGHSSPARLQSDKHE